MAFTRPKDVGALQCVLLHFIIFFFCPQDFSWNLASAIQSFTEPLLASNMSEKLCLQWNDFQENVKIAFQNLRDDKHFTDVTFACEDGQQMEAHKVILAASSPFFQKLLKRNKHPHPLHYALSNEN